jgi:hypothetical protein
MSTLIPRGNISRIFAVAVVFDPASVATITTAEQTKTVIGLKPGDFVISQKPTNTAGVGVVNCDPKGLRQPCLLSSPPKGTGRGDSARLI